MVGIIMELLYWLYGEVTGSVENIDILLSYLQSYTLCWDNVTVTD